MRVLSGFRVTIPEEARNRFPIKIGEELEFAVEGNRLVYIIKDLPEDPVFAMVGLTRGDERELNEVERAIMGEVAEKFKRSKDEIR